MTPTALRALAVSFEVHGSVRSALAAWGDDLPLGEREDAAAVGALVRMGSAPDEACAAVFGGEGVELGEILARGESLGGRVGEAVAAYARRLENDRASARTRDAAAAGAKLSTRIVAGIPAVVAIVAMLRSQPRALTLMLVALGGSLCAMGAAWIARLRPKVRDDATDRLAGALADGIDAGATPGEVLSRLAEGSVYATLLEHLRERVRAGSLWPDALAGAEEPEIRSIGRACVLARRHGTPLSPVLRAIAGRVVEERATEFEAAVRRAPVRMVVPLTLSVLPGALLLVAATFVG